jgi:DNA-binding CsgD family transcriptional regulator
VSTARCRVAVREHACERALVGLLFAGGTTIVQETSAPIVSDWLCEETVDLLVVPPSTGAALAADAALRDERAHGALLIPDDLDALMPSLVAVQHSFQVTGRSLARMLRGLPRLEPADCLLLSSLGLGLPMAEIAERSGCSPSTVKRELGRLRNRLGVDSRSALQRVGADFVEVLGLDHAAVIAREQ